MYRLSRPITLLHKSIVTKSIRPSLLRIHKYKFAGGSKADIDNVSGLGGPSPGQDQNENSIDNPFLWDPHWSPCEEDDFRRSHQYLEHGEHDRWAIPPIEQVKNLDKPDVLKRITKLLKTMERAQTDNKVITQYTHLYNDLGLDSLDQVEFGLALENEFEIEIGDEEAEQVVTVGDAMELIVEHPSAC